MVFKTRYKNIINSVFQICKVLIVNIFLKIFPVFRKILVDFPSLLW